MLYSSILRVSPVRKSAHPKYLKFWWIQDQLAQKTKSPTSPQTSRRYVCVLRHLDASYQCHTSAVVARSCSRGCFSACHPSVAYKCIFLKNAGVMTFQNLPARDIFVCANVMYFVFLDGTFHLPEQCVLNVVVTSLMSWLQCLLCSECCLHSSHVVTLLYFVFWMLFAHLLCRDMSWLHCHFPHFVCIHEFAAWCFLTSFVCNPFSWLYRLGCASFRCIVA